MLKENRWCILATVSCALLLISVDMTVLYTALPRLTQDLGATATEKLWILNAYLLAVAGFLPGFGTLGDRLGHKKMFTWGLIVFGLASLGAAYSPNPTYLIITRSGLGLGAALMMPATLAIIRLTFTDAKERAFAFGVWASVASGGAALGPVLGGLLLEYFWWGSVFLINVPVVLLALLSSGLLVPKNQPNPNQSWSLYGSIVITIGLVIFTYGIKEISHPEPSFAVVIAALLVGLSILTYFYISQKRKPDPLIDFNLFKDRLFTNGVQVALVASMVMVGVELAITQRLQLVLGLSPLQAGLAILPIPVAAFLGGPLGGLALPRLGFRKMMAGTLTMIITGLVVILLSKDTGGLVQTVGLVFFGFGLGSSMAAASCAIMNQAPPNRTGMAASIEELSYELGGVIAIAIFGTILTVVYSTYLVLPPELSHLGAAANDSLDAALSVATKLTTDSAQSLLHLAKESFDLAFSVVLALATALVIALLVILRLSPPTANKQS